MYIYELHTIKISFKLLKIFKLKYDLDLQFQTSDAFQGFRERKVRAFLGSYV